MDTKAIYDEVEEVRASSSSSQDDLARVETMGTVKLSEDHIVYIPAPTADPQGKYHRHSTLSITANLA